MFTVDICLQCHMLCITRAYHERTCCYDLEKDEVCKRQVQTDIAKCIRVAVGQVTSSIDNRKRFEESEDKARSSDRLTVGLAVPCNSLKTLQ